MTMAVPFSVNLDPPLVVKFGVMVTSVTFDRLNSELNLFVASVWRAGLASTAASFESINAVASRATWNAVREALALE